MLSSKSDENQAAFVKCSPIYTSSVRRRIFSFIYTVLSGLRVFKVGKKKSPTILYLLLWDSDGCLR
jgi:hypothetical protein